MNHVELIARRASWLAAILLLLSVGSCGRTGPWIPDARPLAPPLCSRTTGTVHVSLSPDPINPSLRMAQIVRVEWLFWKRCATDIPTDPTQGIGGRQGAACSINQSRSGLQEEIQYSGDCAGPSGGQPPAEWHVGRSTAQPSSIGFDFLGEVQGNVCVRGAVHFSDGSTSPIPTRMWRVQLDAPVRNPPIGFFIGRDAGIDPTFSQMSSSSPDCPEN
jgi:predicted small lipoprotein YifL